MDENLIHFAANEIQRYLQARPASADTVEGIHHWWIKWPGFPESVEVTLAALEQLESSSLVERARLGNREIWRLRRAEEIVSSVHIGAAVK